MEEVRAELVSTLRGLMVEFKRQVKIARSGSGLAEDNYEEM